MSIFISIICLKDKDVVNTVADIYATAAHPQEITTCVILQEDERELDAYKALRHNPNVKVITFPISWAEGCGKARNEAMKHYGEQEYFFQTDAHMRFVRGWDEHLIKELAACPADKPILTTLPPGFNQLTGERDAPTVNELKLYYFYKHIPLHVSISSSLETYAMPLKPIPTPFLAGGVMFGHGSICGCGYDPYFYFHGEEFAANMRLWTRGYTNFTPRFPFCWHAYRTDQSSHPTLDLIDPLRDRKLHERSISRYQHLLGLSLSSNPGSLTDISKYPLGKGRTVADWERTYGIYLSEQRAEPHAHYDWC